MKQIILFSFTLGVIATTGLPNASAGAENPDPLDGQAYVITQGPAACPVGTYSQGVLDARGHLVGVTCNVEGTGQSSMQNTPGKEAHSNSGSRCGAGGWEQGVMDWRGEFRGTMCNYPAAGNGGN